MPPDVMSKRSNISPHSVTCLEIKIIMEILLVSIFSICVHTVHSLPTLVATEYSSMYINMPDVKSLTHDSYICTARQLNPVEAYIVQYEPDAHSQIAHHMMLFGCKSLHSQSNLYPGHWNCDSNLCNGMTVIYGWARNAPAMKLPPNVGFYVGGNSSINYLVLQIHYAKPADTTDNSGLKLHITTERQPFITGIHVLLADIGNIPPRTPKYHIDINCDYTKSTPIHVFAYRVHSHNLGTVITGYKYNKQNSSWTFLAKGNPQWPQAFYPMDKTETITQDDILAARCTYNSSSTSRIVKIGSSTSDEMCNLYLMYYTDYHTKVFNEFHPCIGVQHAELEDLPPGNDEPLPSNLALEQHAHSRNSHLTAITYSDIEKEGFLNNKPSETRSFSSGHYLSSLESHSHSRHTAADDSPHISNHFNKEYKYSANPDWPSKSLTFGQIAAVTIDSSHNIVIFHRGSYVWSEKMFDYFDNYVLSRDLPIPEKTIVTIDSVSGLMLQQWGNNLFFMPHGLTLDSEGQYWLTDVALHQIFCFPQNGGTKPILTLGERFEHGSDTAHFCKPTSVALSKNGDIYVADGYCNARIMRFSAKGEFLNQWGTPANNYDPLPPIGTFDIPHKIVYLEELDMVCVADRENGRIQCFGTGEGEYRFQIQHEEFAGTVYSIAYAKEKGLLFAVSGKPLNKALLSKGFVFNITDQKLINMFSPPSETFSMPHDIYVSSDAEDVYICEIGPDVVWKFHRAYHKSSKKVLHDKELNDDQVSIHRSGRPQIIALNHVSDIEQKPTDIDDINSFETSMIVMALLAIPILILVLITVFVRLRKRGKLQSCSLGHVKGWVTGYRTPHPQDKFNLGNFLNPHKGFDKVAIEESDGDDEISGSDTEEFNNTNAKNA